MIDRIDLNILLEPGARAPQIMQDGDVAADLYAQFEVFVPARGRAYVDTGVSFELPPGFRGRVLSRSGLSRKHGIEVGAGVIDNGYRKPIGVMLYNHTDDDFVVYPGDRVAQIAIERYTHPVFHVVNAIKATERTSGWGSSGLGEGRNV